MPKIEFDNDEIYRLLDDLAVKVPAKVPEALETMARILRFKLVAAAPYDIKNHKAGQKHLQSVITKTNVRGSNEKGKYITIFVSPRGIPGAQLGRRAKENWDKDKHVFKLVVAEYGSSQQAPKPFWNKTVDDTEDTLIKIAENIILNEVDKCGE